MIDEGWRPSLPAWLSQLRIDNGEWIIILGGWVLPYGVAWVGAR